MKLQGLIIAFHKFCLVRVILFMVMVKMTFWSMVSVLFYFVVV